MTSDPHFVETDRSAWRLFVLLCLFIYLVAYVSRYFYLLYFVSNNIDMSDINYDWNFILGGSLNQSFAITSLIFGLFFLSAFIRFPSVSRAYVGYNAPSQTAQAFLLGAIVFCVGMRAIYGTRLGEEVADMPFGLRAPVNRAISDVLPGLILLMMEAYHYIGNKRGYRFWLFVLAGLYLTIAALTASKAGVVFFAASLVMFMYLTGQRILKYPVRILIIGLLILVGFAVGTEIRARAGGTVSEYYLLMQQGEYLVAFLTVLGTFLNRIIGLEGYALSCANSCSTMPDFIALNWDSFSGEAGRIFTQDIVGVKRDFDYRSPGLLGGAALIAGVYGGAILAIAFLRGCVTLLAQADKAGFSVAFKVTAVFGLFRFITEGTWTYVDLVSALGGAALVEVAARALRPRASTTEPMPAHESSPEH